MNFNERKLINIEFDKLHSLFNSSSQLNERLSNYSQDNFDKIYQTYCLTHSNQDESVSPKPASTTNGIDSDNSSDINLVSVSVEQITLNNQNDIIVDTLDSSQTINQTEYEPSELNMNSQIDNSPQGSIIPAKSNPPNDSIFDIPNSDNESSNAIENENENLSHKISTSKRSFKLKLPKKPLFKVTKVTKATKAKTNKKGNSKSKKSNQPKKVTSHKKPINNDQFFHFNPVSYFKFQLWMKYQFKLTSSWFQKVEQASIHSKSLPLRSKQPKVFLKRNLKYSRPNMKIVPSFEKFIDDNRSMDLGITESFKGLSFLSGSSNARSKKNQLIFD